MTPTMIATEQDVIVAEIQISAPAERIFTALTDPKQLQCWFHGGSECPMKLWKMDARPGGCYSYRAETGSIAVDAVAQMECHGEIVECDPPRVLAYSWIATWHENPSIRTLVRWELTPQAGGTHVKVTHSGLAELPTAHKEYSDGWPGVVESLKKYLES